MLVSTTRPDLQPNPGETDLGVISDDVQSYSTAQFGPTRRSSRAGEAADSTVVLHRPNSVEVTKTRGSSTLVSPSGTIPYVITVTNTGQWNMTGFTMVDQVETDAEGSLLVEPDPPAYTFALSGTGAPSGDPGFTASLDETTGLLTITPPDDFVFNAGWTLTVERAAACSATTSPLTRRSTTRSRSARTGCSRPARGPPSSTASI